MNESFKMCVVFEGISLVNDCEGDELEEEVTPRLVEGVKLAYAKPKATRKVSMDLMNDKARSQMRGG